MQVISDTDYARNNNKKNAFAYCSANVLLTSSFDLPYLHTWQMNFHLQLRILDRRLNNHNLFLFCLFCSFVNTIINFKI